MNRIGIISALLMLMLAFVMTGTAAATNEVYFNPQSSSAEYGDTVDVQLRVAATAFRSGEMEFTYNPSCCDVIGFVGNTGDFASVGWDSSTVGRERMTFYAASGDLTGDYLIGTLTIRCENQDVCTTDLVFDEGVSKLFDSSSELSAIWEDGTFSCTATSGQGTNEVYFNPQSSSAEYGDTAEVELRVDATAFRSGEMEFTYNPSCCDVIGFVGNTGDFASVGWDSTTVGRERMTFYAASVDLTGDYLIGTLTIRCESQDVCTTGLVFDEGVSKLFNSSSELSAIWEDGTFSCTEASGPVENEIYFDPSDSIADYSDTAVVELRVDANTFRSGEMEFTYNPGCCDVIGFVGNTGDFASVGWNSPTAGRERITFYASGDLTGDYLIGTLTIRCESQDECTTDMEFDEGVSMLFDSNSEISATWEDGTFRCGEPTDPPTVQVTYPNGGEVLCSMVKITADASDTDGTIDNVEFLYSPNGGASWTHLVNDMSSPYEYTWDTSTVANGTNYLVKAIATDNDSATAMDTSDDVFTIQNPCEGIHLYPGWNFFSVPCVLDNDTAEAVLDGVDYERIYWYNAFNKLWYIPTDIVPLTAYWIKVETHQTIVNIDCGYGTPPSRPMYAGWNPVGLTGTVVPRTAEYAFSVGVSNNNIDDNYSVVWGPWDPVAMTYTQHGFNKNVHDPLGGIESPPDIYTENYMMDMYEGHWIYMISDATLHAVG